MTSLSNKTINNSLTRANSGEISRFSMPGVAYEDLTLGESGTEYTAPGTGYYVFSKTSTGTSQYVSMTNNETGFALGVRYVGSYSMTLPYPVKKGDKIIITYTLGGATNLFRFVYSDGETVS